MDLFHPDSNGNHTQIKALTLYLRPIKLMEERGKKGLK